MLSVGIDASRNRSGGAVAHLRGVLTSIDPSLYGIREVHVWAYKALLDSLPDHSWLHKHSPKAINKRLLSQLLWQRFIFPHDFKRAGCEILLNTDAGTVSRIRPCVTMSRDMLSYEPGVSQLYGFSAARLRLIILRLVQNRSLRFANSVIFLTNYASEVIQLSCGRLESVAMVPHGVGDDFKGNTNSVDSWPADPDQPIRCVYVSNAEPYKNQWTVVRAISMLRKRGYNLKLVLIGGGRGPGQRLLLEAMRSEDPSGKFVEQLDFLPQSDLPRHLANSNIFIFASSCENMPNTLIEAMAMGLPIACSNRGPMPEVLMNGGVYFDPTDAESLASSVQKLIESPSLRQDVSQRARSLSDKYSWRRCAEDTWKVVRQTYEKVQRL